VLFRLVIAASLLWLVLVSGAASVRAQESTPTPTETETPTATPTETETPTATVVLVTATPVPTPTPSIEFLLEQQNALQETANLRALFFGASMVGILALVYLRTR